MSAGLQRSEAAREASRRNGARSRGPRSAKGKRKSCRNALRHGMRAKQTLEPRSLPVWVHLIECRIRSCIGFVTMTRREAIDRALQSMLLIEQVDRAIAEEMAAIHEHLQAPDLARRLAQGSIDLETLRKLLCYRRRFRGTRDKSLRHLTIAGPAVDPHLPTEKPAKRWRRRKVGNLPVTAQG